MPDARGVGLVGEGGQSHQLRNFIQGVQKEDVALHAASVAEKAARAKIFA